MVFTLVVGLLLATCIYDVHVRFLAPVQSMAAVIVIATVATFVMSPKGFAHVLYEQRGLVGGVAALIVYAVMAALSPWLITSTSALLAVAALGVLLAVPLERVSSHASLVAAGYVLARGVAFFATTFWRGVQ